MRSFNGITVIFLFSMSKFSSNNTLCDFNSYGGYRIKIFPKQKFCACGKSETVCCAVRHVPIMLFFLPIMFFSNSHYFDQWCCDFFPLCCDFFPIMLIAIAMKATGRNPDWQVDGLKKKRKNLIVSMTDNNSDREREVQYTGDKDEMYEPLLDDIDVETLMAEGDFEVETGSREELRGVEQEDFAQKKQRRLAGRDRLRTSGEELAPLADSVTTTTTGAARRTLAP